MEATPHTQPELQNDVVDSLSDDLQKTNDSLQTYFLQMEYTPIDELLTMASSDSQYAVYTPDFKQEVDAVIAKSLEKLERKHPQLFRASRFRRNRPESQEIEELFSATAEATIASAIRRSVITHLDYGTLSNSRLRTIVPLLSGAPFSARVLKQEADAFMGEYVERKMHPVSPALSDPSKLSTLAYIFSHYGNRSIDNIDRDIEKHKRGVVVHAHADTVQRIGSEDDIHARTELQARMRAVEDFSVEVLDYPLRDAEGKTTYRINTAMYKAKSISRRGAVAAAAAAQEHKGRAAVGAVAGSIAFGTISAPAAQAYAGPATSGAVRLNANAILPSQPGEPLQEQSLVEQAILPTAPAEVSPPQAVTIAPESILSTAPATTITEAVPMQISQAEARAVQAAATGNVEMAVAALKEGAAVAVEDSQEILPPAPPVSEGIKAAMDVLNKEASDGGIKKVQKDKLLFTTTLVEFLAENPGALASLSEDIKARGLSSAAAEQKYLDARYAQIRQGLDTIGYEDYSPETKDLMAHLWTAADSNIWTQEDLDALVPPPPPPPPTPVNPVDIRVTQELIDSTGLSKDRQVSIETDRADETHWSESDLEKIARNMAMYLAAERETGVPWQIMAVLHKRETGLDLVNPRNGQGMYQFYGMAGEFAPGDISVEEATRQTIFAAERVRDDYATRGAVDGPLSLDNPDKIKDMFFSYNGRASAYKQQAAELGFDPDTQGFEGSPYVMNLADDRRDSSKNPNWGQILRDRGPLEKANRQPGAFVLLQGLMNVTVATPSPAEVRAAEIVEAQRRAAEEAARIAEEQRQAAEQAAREAAERAATEMANGAAIREELERKYQRENDYTDRKGVEPVSGELGPEDLETVTINGHPQQFHPSAAGKLRQLNEAYKAHFGSDIPLTDSYRPFDVQVKTKQKKGRFAATPGTSEHGWGLAFDFNSDGFGSEKYEWMAANAPRYGWYNPGWAKDGKGIEEPWHWEFTGSAGQN